jgi:type I restriction enzyme S subunit
MKLTYSSSAELYQGRYRVDASYFASAGVRSEHLLLKWQKQKNSKNKLQPLGDLCSPGGLFVGDWLKRIYVSSPEHGAIYIAGSDILNVDPKSGSKYLSYRHGDYIRQLSLQKGMILMTCSGTIGSLAYVNQDFLGAVGSPDLLRIVIDPQLAPPGFVFCFLNSNLGKALILKGAYGGVIQHIEIPYIRSIPIPRLEVSIERDIHMLVEQVAKLRGQANTLLEQAKNEIEGHLGFRKPKHSFDHAFSVGTAKIDPDFGMRLDSFGYIGYVEDALKVLNKYPQVVMAQNVGYEFFNPPIFKRMFAASGYPYMSAVNFYTRHPHPERFLSRLQPDVDQYLIRKGMVIMQNAGQRYGLITKPLFITETLDGVAVTSDVIRISHDDPIENGYFCGLFSTDFGRRLALRYSYGTSIPRLDVPKFSMVKIPYPEDQFRRKIGQVVVDAYNHREQANKLENQAQSILAKALEG